MSQAPPEISVVVCTRDRSPQLERTLKAMSRLEFDGHWELVVVDNGSSDDTPAVLGRARGRLGERLRTVQEPVAGLSRARNAGLRAAAAPIVAFTDDDCYPAPDWLTRVVDCFGEDPSRGYLGGRILLHDSRDLPMTILRYPHERRYPPRTVVPPGEIQGANMAMRRDALRRIGGFDVRLGAGTDYPCEDLDAVARLSAEGWTGAYDPRPTVYHHHGRQSKEEVGELLASYLRGAGAYYAKCLADPRLRASCVRWLSRRAVSRPRYAARELAGAFRYWCAERPGRSSAPSDPPGSAIP